MCLLHYALLILVVTVSVNNCFTFLLGEEHINLRCSPNVNSPGTTLPPGDIIIEAGSDLSIYCRLNQTSPLAFDRNASDLMFYNGTTLVSSKYITILNETTINLYIPNVKKSYTINNFVCKVRDEPHKPMFVCMNSVTVDTKPQPVTDFDCIDYNWENINCTWRNPHHSLFTEYELKFRLHGHKNYNHCPNETRAPSSCLWSLSTSPMFRRTQAEYIFNISGKNKLGVWSKEMVLKHFQHVIPAAPVELEVVNKTAHSVTISWKLHLIMEEFTPGIIHKVEYQSTFKNEWKEVDTSAINKISCRGISDTHLSKICKMQKANPVITIDNLEFANTHYDIRVYMKSAVAPPEERFWSKPSNVTFKTLPTKPDSPPKTDIGSFEIIKDRHDKRTVYIYWQQLPEYKYNGANFSYMISKLQPNSDNEVIMKPEEQTNAYAKFDNLDDIEYNFKIYSVNNQGASPASYITIPSKNDILPEPISFTKIAYEETQTYELSWIRPKLADYFSVNYTLYWCANDRDRPYQCTGFLNWTHIPDQNVGSKESIVQNITAPDDKNYQFAISLNLGSRTSGMVWSQCTVIKNNISSRMKRVYTKDIGSSSIVVAWQLECSDRVGVIRGFIVYYCPVQVTECTSPEQSNRTYDASATEFTLTNLRAYTVYRITVAVFTTEGPGEPSDPMYKTTNAAAPSKPPVIVSVHKVTNTSAIFTWEKPSVEERNGIIMYYEFCYNDSTADVVRPPQCDSVPENPKLEKEQSATLMHLNPYTTYRLTIRASTNAWSWSEYSAGYVFSTAIGHPERMSEFRAEYVNETATLISWDPPKKPAGPLNGYQIRINYPNYRNVQEVNASCLGKADNCSALVKLAHPLQCEDHRRPTVQIRAYNLISMNVDDSPLYGEWSKADNLLCTTYGIGMNGTILFFILLSVFFVPLIYFMGRKAYAMFEITSKLGVKLPPGLDIDTKDAKTHFPTHAWNTRDYNDIKPPLPPDEEFLIPSRTANRSESENDSEQASLGSGDTQSSSTSAGSELQPSTPPLHQALPLEVKPLPLPLPTSSSIDIVVNKGNSGYVTVSNAPAPTSSFVINKGKGNSGYVTVSTATPSQNEPHNLCSIATASAIVINKGNSGYVTVSSATASQGESHNCV